MTPLTPNEESVLAGLRDGHVGRENGISGRLLQEKLRIPNRRIREAIESLIRTHRVPIGGDPVHGYYIIANEEEFKGARRELTARMTSLGGRLRALESAFLKEVAEPRQPTFFDDRSAPCE
jgi:hypothetical protein